MNKPLPSLLVVICAAACGGSRTGPSLADHVVVVDDKGAMRRISDETMTALIPAPHARVWPALIAAYAELGIRPTEAVEAHGVFANRGFVFPTRLLDRPYTDFFDCGGGFSTFSSSGRLLAFMESRLSPGADGTTEIVTTVTGRLRSNAGTNTNALDCTSRGRLEEHLRKAVLLRLTQTR